MSVRCKSCGMESADGAAWCDFCKEPFVKKPKAAPAAAPAPAPEPAAPPELAGITKEKVEGLDVDKLLKPASEPPPAAPPWLRPIAWIVLGLTIVTGTIALFALQRRYMERLPAGAAPGAPAPSRPSGAMGAPVLPEPQAAPEASPEPASQPAPSAAPAPSPAPEPPPLTQLPPQPPPPPANPD